MTRNNLNGSLAVDLNLVTDLNVNNVYNQVRKQMELKKKEHMYSVSK